MTSVQRMLERVGDLPARALPIALAGLLVLVGACESHKPVIPARLVSPYGVTRAAIWGVAPPRNESGVSYVDELKVGDALVEQIGQVQGISCLPLNRTLGAMRALGLPSIDTPAQARALARALGADAVVVSSVTAWKMYDPPVIGMNLALFGADIPAAGATDDSRALAASAGGSQSPGAAGQAARNGPLSVVSEVLDASNHGTQVHVQEFGEGRSQPESALGWLAYTKSMTLYTQFACHRMVELLLDAERQRLAPALESAARATNEHTR